MSGHNVPFILVQTILLIQTLVYCIYSKHIQEDSIYDAVFSQLIAI